MNVVWVLCFVGWILSFGVWIFQIVRNNNYWIPLAIMWVFVVLMFLTE